MRISIGWENSKSTPGTFSFTAFSIAASIPACVCAVFQSLAGFRIT